MLPIILNVFSVVALAVILAVNLAELRRARPIRSGRNQARG
jgi:hypothetical protein